MIILLEVELLLVQYTMSGFSVNNLTFRLILAYLTCIFFCLFRVVIASATDCLETVFQNTYFSFFSDFKKTWLFTFFLKWLWKKRKKSVAKILSSMMLTLLQKKKKSLLNVYRNFGLKTPDVMGHGYLHYRRLSHMQFSVAYFLVSTLLSKMFDVGDRDLPVLTSGNWAIKGWVVNWPVKLRMFFYVFLRFFSKSKKRDFLRFFEWLTTFSRTMPGNLVSEMACYVSSGTCKYNSLTRSLTLALTSVLQTE